MMTIWFRTAFVVPEEGEVVEAKDSGGHVHKLQRLKNLWFIPDGSMYVYFTPAEWRYIPKAEDYDQDWHDHQSYRYERDCY